MNAPASPITTPTVPASDPLVQRLTEYADTSSYDKVFEEIYNPGREADDMLRHAEARGEVLSSGPPRRRMRHCGQCGKVYGGAAHHGKRFCSWACFLASPKPTPRSRPAQVIPSVQEVRDEMQAALARLGEVLDQ